MKAVQQLRTRPAASRLSTPWPQLVVGRLRPIARIASPPEAPSTSQDAPIAEQQAPTSTGSLAATKLQQQMQQQEAMEKGIAARKEQRKREQMTYQISAIVATVGVVSIAILATYLRFSWHLREEGAFPWLEMGGTLALVAGGVFGMEMWARYAHKSLWHDYEPGWSLHKSHHEPRTGPFEANDIYAIVNAVPAMSLCAYGFVTPNVVGGLCFGAGLGITLFGIMYMFVHDGLVHRRFPVGPIAELPYLKRIAVAHQLHHANKYDGAPWGMFLAMQELENIPGAKEEVERMVQELDFSKR